MRSSNELRQPNVVCDRPFDRSSRTQKNKLIPGRYGLGRDKFDYSPATIRASVQRSLDRLGTSYIDLLLLHDVEFVCSAVEPADADAAARPLRALDDLAAEWGVAEGQEAVVHGPGDETILAAVRELWKLKDEGVVRAVGISGTPAQRP